MLILFTGMASHIGNYHYYMIQTRLEYLMLILLQDISCAELTVDCMRTSPPLHRGVSYRSHDLMLQYKCDLIG